MTGRFLSLGGGGVGRHRGGTGGAQGGVGARGARERKEDFNCHNEIY